jgi:hypothetical protein
MKRILLLSALAASVFCVGSARADEFTISFTSISGLGFFGSATVDANSLGGDVFQITGVEAGGSVTDGAGGFGTSAITDINGAFGSDNELFFPGGAQGFFDGNGLTFGLANGVNVNLFAADNGNGTFSPAAIESNPNGDIPEFVSEAVTPVQSTSPVPEPGSLALLGTSVFGAAGMLRKRFRA